jgi:hypothetical protein
MSLAMQNCFQNIFRFLTEKLPFIIALALGSITSNMAFAGSMIFYEATTGGTMLGSNWIAAEGEIIQTTADDFRKFVKEIPYGGCGDVMFNSPGGNLYGAIELGKAIHELCNETSIGRTVQVKLLFSKGIYKVYEAERNDGAFNLEPATDTEADRGTCASACVYAFLGGKTRHVDKNHSRLFVHQFYQSTALETPEKKQFNSLDLAGTQITMGRLVSYLISVGADPRIASIAAEVLPDTVYELTAEDVERLNINKSYTELTEPELKTINGHLVAVSSNPDGATWSMYCDAKSKLLTVFYRRTSHKKLTKDEELDNEGIVNANYKGVSSIQFGGIELNKSYLVPRYHDGMLDIIITLPKNIENYPIKDLNIGVNGGGMSAVYEFAIWIPTKNAHDLLSVLSKNCY